MTAPVERHAGRLARTNGLRGADAVPLASALAIGDPHLVVAAWGEWLHAGVKVAHLRVAPLDLTT